MIVPLLHRIVVRPEAFDEFSEEYKRMKQLGWVIPELEELKRAQASVDRGVVVSVGETAYRDYGVEPPVKAGDVVNYARHSGKFVKDLETGEDFVILNDEDLICIIKEENV